MDYLAERTQITRSCATGSSIGGIGSAAQIGGSARGYHANSPAVIPAG
jgi:hypothetical protein